MIKWCPRCQQSFMFDDGCEDVVHQCFGSEVLANDDIKVVGDWEDFTGSGIEPSQKVNMQGVTNTAFGTRTQIEGGKVIERTVRGNNIETTRIRRHEEFVKLK